MGFARRHARVARKKPAIRSRGPGSVGRGKNQGKSGKGPGAAKLTSLRVTFWECLNRLDLERCRGDLALLPRGKRERYFRLACARFLGSPHGAVETVPSASLCQRHAPSDRWLARLPMRP